MSHPDTSVAWAGDGTGSVRRDAMPCHVCDCDAVWVEWETSETSDLSSDLYISHWGT